MHVNTTPTDNPVISNILATNSAVLEFTRAAQIAFGKSPSAAYAERARGTFPVRVRQHGKRLVVFTSDLIQYLQTGESQAEQSAPLIRKICKVKTGRPSKRESIDANARGLSIRELRAQRALQLGGAL